MDGSEALLWLQQLVGSAGNQSDSLFVMYEQLLQKLLNHASRSMSHLGSLERFIDQVSAVTWKTFPSKQMSLAVFAILYILLGGLFSSE